MNFTVSNPDGLTIGILDDTTGNVTDESGRVSFSLSGSRLVNTLTGEVNTVTIDGRVFNAGGQFIAVINNYSAGGQGAPVGAAAPQPGAQQFQPQPGAQQFQSQPGAQQFQPQPDAQQFRPAPAYPGNSNVQPSGKGGKKVAVAAVICGAAVLIAAIVAVCVILVMRQGDVSGGKTSGNDFVGTWECVILKKDGNEYERGSKEYTDQFCDVAPTIEAYRDGNLKNIWTGEYDPGKWKQKSDNEYIITLFHTEDGSQHDETWVIEGDRLIVELIDEVWIYEKKSSEEPEMKAKDAEIFKNLEKTREEAANNDFDIVGTWELVKYVENGKEFIPGSPEFDEKFSMEEAPTLEIDEDGTYKDIWGQEYNPGTWKKESDNIYSFTISLSYEKQEGVGTWEIRDGQLIYEEPYGNSWVYEKR